MEKNGAGRRGDRNFALIGPRGRILPPAAVTALPS
jgi:hypothetical protein